MATIYIGTVISNEDTNDGERLRIQILPADKFKKDSEIPYAFPLLPKMLHVKPKVGEAALVICTNDDNPRSQRYYLGPVISQSHLHYREDAVSSTALLKGGAKSADIPASNQKKAIGAFAKDDDIAIYGRKNGDIIISDNDIRIRCGVHLVNETDKTEVGFNKGAAAYIKLKYYPSILKKETNINEDLFEEGVSSYKNIYAASTTTIVGDKINIISPNGNPYFNTTDPEEGISDKEMLRVLEEAHQLPYGDTLVKFLAAFVKMFKSHTHKYHNMPPCPDGESLKFDTAYGFTEEDYKNKLLSNVVRIN